MKYYIRVNRKFQYMKVYVIKKKIHESGNKISRLLSSFLEKRMSGKKE